MQKLKRLLKALYCLLKPKPREITVEEFMEMESKKIIKKPNNERNSNEFYDL